MRAFASSERKTNMEYAIAIFVGVWVAAAGMLAYWRISKDFKNATNDKKEDRSK